MSFCLLLVRTYFKLAKSIFICIRTLFLFSRKICKKYGSSFTIFILKRLLDQFFFSIQFLTHFSSMLIVITYVRKSVPVTGTINLLNVLSPYKTYVNNWFDIKLLRSCGYDNESWEQRCSGELVGHSAWQPCATHHETTQTSRGTFIYLKKGFQSKGMTDFKF